MSNHDKAKQQVRAQFGDSVDFSPGTSGRAMAELIEGHLDKLDELRRELDLASWPSVDHANAMLKAAAAEHARLVAEGMPPLKPHEILAVFREAGCLYERKPRRMSAVAVYGPGIDSLTTWMGATRQVFIALTPEFMRAQRSVHSFDIPDDAEVVPADLAHVAGRQGYYFTVFESVFHELCGDS